MSAERLQKFLARAGVTSRRKAEELIRQGRVTVNSRVASLGDKANPQIDAIKVNGERIRPPRGRRRYILLNKPRGVMSTRSDPQKRPTVFDLIPPAEHKALVTVGRLDFNSEGLIILTDDGEFAHRIAHPRYGCRKTYEVKVKGVPTEEKLMRLRQGISLAGKRTGTARITRLKRPSRGRQPVNSWWTVELTEGRTRQIREMFFRIGHPIQRLSRVAIGSVSDGALQTGCYRELSRLEKERLLRPESGSSRGGRGGPRRRGAREGAATPRSRRKPSARRSTTHNDHGLRTDRSH